jgi:hypothetical protein
MIGHLDLQSPLQDSFDHPADQPIGAVDPHPGCLGVGQQRVDMGRLEQLSHPHRRQIIHHSSGSGVTD